MPTHLIPSLVLAAALAGATANAADSAPVVTPNWAGYAVAAQGTSAIAFTSVTGTWITPAVRCPQGSAGAASAVWVGIGGFREATLEQIGTDANCGRSLQPVYYAWFEVAPFPAVPIRLRLRPGDTMTASVNVRAGQVELQLKNQTRRWTFTRTISSVMPGTASAEWIVEAPASCVRYSCSQTPLANFGSVTMTGIAATGDFLTSTLANPTWTIVPIALMPNAVSAATPPESSTEGNTPSFLAAGATAGPITTDGTAFTVSWMSVPVNTAAQW
jgi:hypothetical protein